MSAVDSYVNIVQERLIRDGCSVTNESIGLMPVVVGYKTQMRALSKMHVFVAVAKVNLAGAAELREFVDAVVNVAVERKGKWRGMQSGIVVLPVLVAQSADAEAAALTRRVYRLNMGGFAVFAQPVVVDVTEGNVWTFRGIRLWGYAFNSLIRQKCAIYLPKLLAE